MLVSTTTPEMHGGNFAPKGDFRPPDCPSAG
jgi:hypothetical protein